MKTRSHLIGICLLVSALSVPGTAGAQHAGREQPARQEMSLSEGRKAIERFMGVTALWIIEMEWTFGHDNKTPSQADRAKAMLAADVTTCPGDFRDAWLMQVENPRRNYIAPLLRKYGVKLSSVRKDIQSRLRSIDSSVRPPVPLYDDDEKPERYDPTACGSQAAILAAVNKLRAKMNGVDPARAGQWQEAIRNVMRAFSLNFMETYVCMNVAGIPRRDVEAMFDAIDVKQCPPDFIKAWEQDLPAFKKGDFGAGGLKIPVLCKKYGVDEDAVLNEIKAKMREWEISIPDITTQQEFRKQMKLLRSNLLDYRSDGAGRTAGR